MTAELALFAGAGGGVLGGSHLLGWTTVAAVEVEPYARRVLAHRMPAVSLHDDVRTLDGRAYAGAVDVVTGGFPCQDISVAGRGAGIAGARSGLWREMARIIGEAKPTYVLAENSPALVGRGLDVVLRDLHRLGYVASWGIVGAHHAIGMTEAPVLGHYRDRIWILASRPGAAPIAARACLPPLTWWDAEPCPRTVPARVVPNRRARLKAIGNGQVPLAMALAVVTLRRQTGGVVVGHVTDRGILAAQRSLWDAEPIAPPRWGAMTEAGAVLERTPPPLSTCAADIAPTPTVCGLHNRKGASAKSGNRLATWVRPMLPTPLARDASSGRHPLNVSTGRTVRGCGASLAERVRMLATPTARDWRSGSVLEETHARNARPLSEQVGGLLSPDWTEWLMGWPVGWSGLDDCDITAWLAAHGGR